METSPCCGGPRLREGALEPIQTQSCLVRDRSVPFLVRVVSSLRNKPLGGDDYNPFLPYERALYVADASPTHACILNKYNVVDFHLLIITRQFEHQETLLTLPDFLALWRCLVEYDSLGFYNSGTTSGASQKHKHLQVVPLPLVTDDLLSHNALPDELSPTVPLESLLQRGSRCNGEIGHIDQLPFNHAIVHWDHAKSYNVVELAEETYANYLALLRHVGIPLPNSPSQQIVQPYNLLVCRRWMLLVPRTHECFKSISFNSLAFAGALLVQDKMQLERLQAAGPFAALEHVAQRHR